MAPRASRDGRRFVSYDPDHRLENVAALDTQPFACAISPPLPCGPIEVNLVEIHELLVLKNDGRVERFRVTDGDVAQAELRASLCRRPGDDLVVVTEHAYIRSKPTEHASEPSSTTT